MGLVLGDINLYRSAEFRLKVANMKEAVSLSGFEAKGFIAGVQGTLGQFTIILNGKICPKGSGWKYEGTIRYKDTFNFNPQPILNRSGQTGRTFSGEVKTRYANNNLPGKGFPVTSVDAKFMQTSSMSRGDWSGKSKTQEAPISFPWGGAESMPESDAVD